MKDYVPQGAARRNAPLAARHAKAPVTAGPAGGRAPYQLTPAASKNNAFCWLSWEPQVRWRGSKDEVEAQAKRAQATEQKRAAGIDPLHMTGTGSKAVMDPARFALPGMTRTPWAKGLPGARK